MYSHWLIFRLVTATVAAVACFVFAAFLFLHGKDRRVSLLFAFSNLFLGLWNISDPAIALAPTHGVAIFLDRLSYLWATLLVVVFFRFVSAIIGGPLARKTMLSLHLASGIILSGIALTPLLIRDVQTRPNLIEIPGPIFPFFCVYFVLSILVALIGFNTAWRRAEGLRRNQLKYLALGVNVGSLTGALYLWTMFQPSVPPVYYVMELTYVSLVPITIVKVKMMDINMALRYSVVYLVLGLGLGLPFAALMWLVSGNPLVAALSFPLPTIGYFLIQRSAAKVMGVVDLFPIFRGRYDALRILEHHEREVAQGGSLAEWAERLVKATQDILCPENSFVLVRESAEETFLIKAGHGIDPARRTFLSVPVDGPLVSQAKVGGILLKEIIEQETPPASLDLRKEMEFLGAEVVVPIYFREQVQALLCLGPKVGRDMFNDVDFAGLHGLAKSAELALNALLSGTMREWKTAAWAHDLLQPLGPKSGMGVMDALLSGNYGALPPSAQKALTSLKSDMEFLTRNIKQLLEGGPLCSVKLTPILPREMYEKLRTRYAPLAKELEITWNVMTIPPGLMISADEIQLERRVLGNLIENALRHTPKGGTVEIGYRTDGNEFVGWVKDTGPGIKPEDQKRIFEPGVQVGEKVGLGGLGLYSVKTVIESHGGRVWVESEVGKGSTFYFVMKMEL